MLMPSIVDNMRPVFGLFGRKYKSISPQIPRQKLITAKAISSVMETCFMWVVLILLFKGKRYIRVLGLVMS